MISGLAQSGSVPSSGHGVIQTFTPFATYWYGASTFRRNT